MSNVNILLVKSYTTNVYMTGRNSLSNIAANRSEYVQPVMQHAADSLYIDYIGRAKDKGFITEQEHDDTLALKGPEDPQYLPPIDMNSVEQPTTEA
ncbi:hypothetical protein [Psychrobacillus sp. FSL K6-1267]|uniref:hypothetical protein n=1 Tax=Psychrobacillus sp. FSL K6-1267 TaxID=2921543 RepID=UPI0030FC931B